ncbi:MAG: tetratricopeptide repeat protein [bacterium]
MKLHQPASMMFRQIILLAFLIFLPISSSFASEIEALFIKANEYYQNGDYKAAIAEYSKIHDLGYESWEVYYNLGNAYYKDRQIARAILNFERAKKLNPKNEDIQFNLELANLTVADRIPQLPALFIFTWLSNIAQLFSMQMLGAITLAVYLSMTVIIFIRIFFKSNRFKRASFVAIIFATILLLFFSGIFFYRVYENETKIEAIVLVDKVDVKSAPDEAGTELFALHAGVKVQIKDRSNNWIKIRLNDGKVGWLKDDIIEKI